LLVLVLAAPACSQPATTPSAGKPAVLNGKPNPPRPSLADAIRVARDLGPAGATKYFAKDPVYRRFEH